MQKEDFKSGIYRHYKGGDLYFAEDLELDADMNVDTFRVRYRALYPGKLFPFSRSLEGKDGFNELKRKSNSDPREFTELPVPRFTLVMELPVEKMKMLLPRTSVLSSGFSTSDFIRYKVVRVFEAENNQIWVELAEEWRESLRRTEPISKFLNDFSL